MSRGTALWPGRSELSRINLLYFKRAIVSTSEISEGRSQMNADAARAAAMPLAQPAHLRDNRPEQSGALIPRLDNTNRHRAPAASVQHDTWQLDHSDYWRSARAPYRGSRGPSVGALSTGVTRDSSDPGRRMLYELPRSRDLSQ